MEGDKENRERRERRGKRTLFGSGQTNMAQTRQSYLKLNDDELLSISTAALLFLVLLFLVLVLVLVMIMIMIRDEL